MSVVSTAVDELAERYWEAVLEADPLQATVVGERGHDHRLPDLSPAGVADSIRRFEEVLAAAATAVPDPANPDQALTLSALRHSAEANLASLRADAHSYTVDATWGMQTQIFSAASYQPLRDPEDGRAMLERWRAIATTLMRGR
jgi:uncharacterized protein (DUF885 family)